MIIKASVNLRVRTFSSVDYDNNGPYWKAKAFLPDGREYMETDFYDHYETEELAIKALKKMIKEGLDDWRS